MSENFSRLPLDLAQSSPYFIMITTILALLLTNNKWCLYFLISYLILGEGMNHLEKYISKKIVGDKDPWVRPNPPETGCGIFNQCNTGSKTFGFPSGHAQMVTFSAIFWSLYIQKYTLWSKEEKIVKISILWVLVGLICYSRVYIGCHNWIQIMGGSFFGILYGVLSFYAIEKYLI
jgi:membrane-associated phospholipid phosphatase